MKDKKGFVVLQLSIFLGLLAFIGLMIFEIQVDKKKFIDVSSNKDVDEKNDELNIGKATTKFKEKIELSNLTETELLKQYSEFPYNEFDIKIYYDLEEKLFIAKKNKSYGNMCIEYYDYEVELCSDNDIIKIVKFYKV
ncbi:hypothetical protein [uncultured Clostridium sp.]|jgi:hypothetical protein|uniref:hypothetical protein n=1 Tax=uncultured Clostridium sp. TaxID=59620 RepID=UPI00260750F7|nr:hypothetical protein [uncultured Clostridium sp.]